MTSYDDRELSIHMQQMIGMIRVYVPHFEEAFRAEIARLRPLPPAGDTVAVKREWLRELPIRLNAHLPFKVAYDFSMEISRLLDGRQP